MVTECFKVKDFWTTLFGDYQAFDLVCKGPVRLCWKNKLKHCSDWLVWEKNTVPTEKTSWKVWIISRLNKNIGCVGSGKGVANLKGKIFSATSSVQPVKTSSKPYLGVFKKFETMHINSGSVDVHYHKIWDSNSFCKNSYENNKFHLHIESQILWQGTSTDPLLVFKNFETP
jgi:hypothetical protein